MDLRAMKVSGLLNWHCSKLYTYLHNITMKMNRIYVPIAIVSIANYCLLTTFFQEVCRAISILILITIKSLANSNTNTKIKI